MSRRDRESDSYQYSILSYFYGNIRVREAIRLGVDVNQASNYGCTPLLFAKVHVTGISSYFFVSLPTHHAIQDSRLLAREG